MRKTIIYTHFPKKQDFFPKNSGFPREKKMRYRVSRQGSGQKKLFLDVLEERIQRGEKIAFSAEDLAKHEEWRKKHYKQKPPQREV